MTSRISAVPRTIAVYATGVYATVGAGLLTWFLAARNPTDPRVEPIIRWWARRWLRAARCTLEVSGLDHVDISRSYVVVANHVSNFDVMACFASLPIPIRYLAKKELFSIPILAQAMRAVGIVEVDRGGRAAAIASVNRQAQPVIERGHSLIIFPEGTRSYHGDLQAFKKGAFAIAAAAGMPLLPVAISGTWEAWKPHSPWITGHATIRIVVDAPVETDGLDDRELDRLRTEIHDTIAANLSV